MSNPQYPPPATGGGNGTLILVLGILSLIPCLNILGPVAWIMGNNAMATADPAVQGQVNAGRICGIIGTVFLILGVIYYIFFGAAMMRALHSASPTSMLATPFLWL